MNLKRIRTSISALVLATMMIVPGVSVCAATSPTETTKIITPNGTTSKATVIQKAITSAQSVYYYGAEFQFTFTQEGLVDSATGEAIPEGWSGRSQDAPGTDYAVANETKVTLDPVTIRATQNAFDKDEATKTNVPTYDPDKKKEIIAWTQTLTGDIDLSAFTIPGVYTYIVREATGTASGVGSMTWTYDGAEYRMRVYVENVANTDGSTTLQKSVTMERIKDSSGQTVSEKENAASFDNAVSEVRNFKLQINATDEYGTSSADDQFGFTITGRTFVDETVMPTPKVTIDGQLIKGYTYDVYNADGSLVSAGNKVADGGMIYLKAGQYAMFDNLSVGMWMTVDEKDIPDAVDEKKISILEEVPGESDVADGEGTKHKKDKIPIYEGDYKKDSEEFLYQTTLTYNNVYKEPKIIITGVVTDIAPYITIVVIAIAAIAAYIIVRRRMR